MLKYCIFNKSDLMCTLLVLKHTYKGSTELMFSPFFGVDSIFQLHATLCRGQHAFFSQLVVCRHMQ